MRPRSAAALLAALAAALWLGGFAGCSAFNNWINPPDLVGIPLQWRPTSNLAELQAEGGVIETTQSAAAKVVLAPFTDGRADPATIAENREEKTPRPVTTQDDVPAFVTRHLREAFAESGIALTEGEGDVTVRGEVKDFFVKETQRYDGLVRFSISVTRGQALIWSGIVTGTASRFGRSYRAENYCETLSDALLDAANHLVRDSGFRHALGRKAPQ